MQLRKLSQQFLYLEVQSGGMAKPEIALFQKLIVLVMISWPRYAVNGKVLQILLAMFAL
jgi:hypothetical protein